jgi:hypothetical protein
MFSGEVSYEEAHRIGKELADKVLEGKYSYVLTTHIDKGHIHNHIIFCAADNIEQNKYHDCKQSYYHIRKLSDELCKKHNLSIIIPGGERGKKYKEWQSEQNGSTWKTQLRRDINFCIKSASTYEDFLLLMRAKGYEIKGESFEESAAKYISFRPLDKERFVRGSTKSLGKEYTKERIRERIEMKRERKSVIPKKDKKDAVVIEYDSLTNIRPYKDASYYKQFIGQSILFYPRNPNSSESLPKYYANFLTSNEQVVDIDTIWRKKRSNPKPKDYKLNQITSKRYKPQLVKDNYVTLCASFHDILEQGYRIFPFEIYRATKCPMGKRDGIFTPYNEIEGKTFKILDIELSDAEVEENTIFALQSEEGDTLYWYAKRG